MDNEIIDTLKHDDKIKRSKHLYNLLLDFRVVKKLFIIFLFGLLVVGSMEYFSAREIISKSMNERTYYFDDGKYLPSYFDYLENTYGNDTSRPVDVSYILDESQKSIGLLYAVAIMAIIGTVLIQRESFNDKWYWTLRRIPKYRMGYFVNKFLLTIIPAIVYWLVYIVEANVKYIYYMSLVPEPAKNYSPVRSFHFYTYCEPEYLICAFIMISAAILLLNLSLRDIKRNILGLVIAVTGAVVAFYIALGELSVTWIIVTGVVVMIASLVWHVYRKL